MKPLHKNMVIGLVVLTSLFFTVRSLVFLHPRPGDGKYLLKVRFQNIDKLSKGTKVTFAGKAVGEVIAVTPLLESRQQTQHKEIYPYELTLALDSGIRVYDSDEISVKTAGLMGEQFIAISPRPPSLTHTPTLLDNDSTVYASGGVNMEETVSGLSNVARKAELTMDTILTLIQKNQEAITATMQSLEKATGEFEQLITKLNSGNGTIGKLVNDDEAYYRSLRVLNRTDLLLSDINNYGILFHLDRSWQRQRRSRLEEAELLKTPEQIRTYVDEEMRSITVSFSRLDDALERAQTSAESGESLKNPKIRQEFTDSYKALLQNVQELEAKLKTVGSVLGKEATNE